jgi:hypothetical protein
MVGRWRMLVPALLAAAALPLLHGEAGQTAGLGPRPIRVDGHYAEVWGQARKTVLLLPHGGWAGDGPGGVRELRPAARRFVAMGWRALTVSYANGAAGLETVAAGWREATRTGPACVYGESSGAHWALMLATRDRSVHCVAAAAAPTDLTTWPADIPSRGIRRMAFRLRTAAFGRRREELARLSPALHWPRDGCTRLVQVSADNDPIVPPDQATELQRRAPGSTLVRLGAGGAPWVHSRVDAVALEGSWSAVRRTFEAAPPNGCG